MRRNLILLFAAAGIFMFPTCGFAETANMDTVNHWLTNTSPGSAWKKCEHPRSAAF